MTLRALIGSRTVWKYPELRRRQLMIIRNEIIITRLKAKYWINRLKLKYWQWKVGHK